MFKSVGLITAVLALLLASGGSAQPVTARVDQQGRIIRLDPQANVIVLDDGRMVRTTPDTVILIDDRPVQYGALEPGATVVVRSGEVVVLRDGHYVTLAESGPAGVTATPGAATAGAPVVAVVPASPVVLQDGTVSGTVTSVDLTQGLVRLSDGRAYLTSPKTAIIHRNEPIDIAALRPGMTVTMGPNPVVSRDGRVVVLNEGWEDSDNLSAMTWDSRYAGYEGLSDNASMQVQAGGGAQ
jgi:hypothetical protein